MIITYKTILIFIIGVITGLIIIDAWRTADKELATCNGAFKYKISYCLAMLSGGAFLIRFISDLL